MKIFVLFLFLFLCAASAQAAPSLFFTEEETAAIEEDLARHAQDFRARDAGLLSLESVVFYAPDRWTLWIDGEKWTPETRKEGLEIVDVAPDQAQLRVSPPRSGVPRLAVLRAHQSLDLATGDIAESR